jgi:hypothetical protein
VAGETEAHVDSRESVKRKDSGISGGNSTDSLEAAAPKARDFAIPPTPKQNARNEKHDSLNKTVVTTDRPRLITAASSKGTFHHPYKENLGMGRRWKDAKNAVITKFGALKQA